MLSDFGLRWSTKTQPISFLALPDLMCSAMGHRCNAIRTRRGYMYKDTVIVNNTLVNYEFLSFPIISACVFPHHEELFSLCGGR